MSPKHQESSDLIYHLLAAEIAGSRSQLSQSVDHYLQAARLSRDPNVAQRATRIAAFSQNPEAATLAAERWVELAPGDSDARETLALLYFNNKQLDQALSQLEALLEVAGTELDNEILKIGFLLAKQSDKEAALTLMSRLQPKYADNANIYFGIGHLAFQSGELDQAYASVERALSLKPDLYDAMALQARIRLSQGKVQPALSLMRKLLKAQPDSRQYRIAYARLLTEANEYGAAREQFEKLLAKAPDDPELLYALALLAIESKKLDQAEQYLLRMPKDNQRIDEARFLLGDIAESRGDYDAAIQWFAQVRKGERKAPALINIAILLGKKGEIETARNYLQQLRGRSPELAARLFIVESEILKQADRNDEAMEVLDKGIAQLPENNDLYYARSLIAEVLGRIDFAEQDLRKVLATDPDNRHALNALGYMLADNTLRYQEALELIQRAYDLSPDEPAIIDSMGWVYFRMNQLEKAVEYLRRAYELHQDGEIAAHLSEVLWVKGDRAEARKIWQRTLKGDPDNRYIKEVMQRLEQ